MRSVPLQRSATWRAGTRRRSAHRREWEFYWPIIRDLARERWVPAFFLGSATLAVTLGCLDLAANSLDQYALPALGILTLALLLMNISRFKEVGVPDVPLTVLLGLSVLAAAGIGALPDYFGGYHLNGIVQRSVASAPVLVAVGLPSLCASLYFLLGATPRAEDISRYPLVVLPVVVALALYAVLLLNLLAKGLPQLDLAMVFRPYIYQNIPIKRTDAAGNVVDAIQNIKQIGMANHLVGTLTLIVLTAVISLPIGVAAGLFVREFSRGFPGRVVKFSCAALRGVSVYILGLTAVSLVDLFKGTPLALLFSGYHLDAGGTVRPGTGSFLTAAMVMSMLVIPIIARSTEEGCDSVPAGLREGSTSLGAPESYTLRRIVLPWALPNIVTGLLLGSAEVAGSLATILFIATTGDSGLDSRDGVTSLSYVIFGAQYSGSKPFRDAMMNYRYGATVLLLILSLVLAGGSMVVKRAVARRGRGA